MKYSNLYLKFKSKKLWADPGRKIQTLESFSQTETDAGLSILRALQYVKDDNLRRHLKRHADDELRHGVLFNTRAQELRAINPNLNSISSRPDKLYKLDHETRNSDINSHGFYTSDKFEELGEIMYVCMLHLAEKKAENTFNIHLNSIRNDNETKNIFKEILKDEHYHVSYTKKFLTKWKRNGNNDEVKAATSSIRRALVYNSIARTISKIGEKSGYFILFILYFSVIVPFALISKFSLPHYGWKKPFSGSSKRQIHSQY